MGMGTADWIGESHGSGVVERQRTSSRWRWLPALLLAALPFGPATAQGMRLQHVEQVSAGGYHSCAVIAGGTVKCWGENSSGQLGDGSTEPSPWPVDVAGLTDVVQVSAGDAHTCARTLAGRVLCWGANPSGQLGNGGTGNQLHPVEVVNLSGATHVSAGFSHTCAVADGAARCWGHNGSGQLGNGGTTNAATPVNVTGLASGVTQVTTGDYHSCARTANGIQCWGSNENGQLGNTGAGNGSSTPVAVSGLTGATSVSAGFNSTCALVQNGGVRCWGVNWYGELGDGTTDSSPTPVAVLGLSGVVELDAGGYHACARTGTGTATCWGGGWNGALGNGSLANHPQPVAVAGLGSGGIVQINAGTYHTCAITTGAELLCWGSNATSQLGNGELSSRTRPVAVPGLSGISSIATGFRHSCALRANGELSCWGSNSYGQIGDGNQDTNANSPTEVASSGPVAAVAPGFEHTCALLADGHVECWGSNQSAQLGIGHSGTSEPLPVTVPGLAQVVALAAGLEHTCALVQGGGVKCWGHNGLFGLLGDGSGTDPDTLVDVTGLGSGVAAIGAGMYHTCALMLNGGVKCWGGNFEGQLGDGSTDYRTTPVDVPGLSGIVAIGTGPYHTCALASGGGVWCWGNNITGQLGTGDNTGRLTPTPVIGLPGGVTAIASSGFHNCVRTQAGAAWCWGQNYDGELGIGSHAHALQPAQVSGLGQGVAAVSVGGYHSCALGTDGGVKCWGFHGNGQLGLGGSDSSVPGYVLERAPTNLRLAVIGSATIVSVQGVRLRVSNDSEIASGIVHVLVDDAPTRFAPLSSCTASYADGVATVDCGAPSGIMCTASEGICEFTDGLGAGQSADIFLAPSSSDPIRIGIHEEGIEIQSCTLSGTTCTEMGQ